MSNLPRINGLILAGGRSRRMGHNKSLISFHNKPQREYLFDLLNNYCENVYTSCKNDDDIPLSLNPLPDSFNIESPLNGILSAFQFNDSTSWLTVPVDMPNVNHMVLDYLITNRSIDYIATCFFDSDGQQPEPLLTLWEPHAAPLLRIFYDEGKFSPREFLKQSKIKLLNAPDVNTLRNINTPDELENYLDKNRTVE